MFHSRTLNNKINRLHERALRITSFMKSNFPLSRNIYNLRNDHDFKTENIRTVSYGSETIAFRGPKIWAFVPKISKTQILCRNSKLKLNIGTHRKDACVESAMSTSPI